MTDEAALLSRFPSGARGGMLLTELQGISRKDLNERVGPGRSKNGHALSRVEVQIPGVQKRAMAAHGAFVSSGDRQLSEVHRALPANRQRQQRVDFMSVGPLWRLTARAAGLPAILCP